MPLESGTTIADLNASWPTGGDPKSEGDDHLRLLKTVVKNDVHPKADVYTKAEADAEFVPASSVQTVEIVEADITSRWQVWGDVLIQWGSTNTTLTGNLVTFVQPFEGGTFPSVTAQAVTGTGRFAAIQSVTNAQFLAQARDLTGAQVDILVYWQAIGEAPDALKKPKTIEAL